MHQHIWTHYIFCVFFLAVSSPQTINITENYQTKTKTIQPAIHIAALPTRSNQQTDLPSFSIPLQYNLGTFKKIGEDGRLDLETNDNHWDNRMIPSFNLMNIKPLLETRENADMSEVKYEVKNESRVYEMQTLQSNIEAEDILKESINEGQTITPDFEIQRYQNYNDNDKRFRGTFDEVMEDRNSFVGDFLCKNNFDKVDEKRSEFEECNLLETDNSVGITNFENNL